MVVALAVYYSQVLLSLVSAILMLFFFFKMTKFDIKWGKLKYKRLIEIFLIVLTFTLLFALRCFIFSQ